MNNVWRVMIFSAAFLVGVISQANISQSEEMSWQMRSLYEYKIQLQFFSQKYKFWTKINFSRKIQFFLKNPIFEQKSIFFKFLLRAHRWFSSRRNKDQRLGIHAITFACRCRAVVKHMPQVRPAFAIHNSNSHHAGTLISYQVHRIRSDRRIKARPSCSGIKFCFRTKKRLQAGSRIVSAFFIKMIIFSCTRTFGTFFAKNIILSGR